MLGRRKLERNNVQLPAGGMPQSGTDGEYCRLAKTSRTATQFGCLPALRRQTDLHLLEGLGRGFFRQRFLRGFTYPTDHGRPNHSSGQESPARRLPFSPGLKRRS